MLSYAFTTLNQSNFEDVATEEFENMHNLFAAILAKGIGQQLKQGLYREYLDNRENMAVVRGKIDLSGTVKNKIARRRILSCEYDDLSENNLLNQILKTTVMLLLLHSKSMQSIKTLSKKKCCFSQMLTSLNRQQSGGRHFVSIKIIRLIVCS
jgi:5-methylcytosine-specific restriction enzyme subunit McrC